MIISINVGNTFDEVHHKNFQKTRNGREISEMNRGHLSKTFSQNQTL